jgi:exonuclease SbcC
VQASRLMDELTLHDELAAPWMELSELMGSADGARFRKFAQGLALVQLLGLANAQMTRLKPRYVITRVPGTDLEIAIVDRHQADQIRPVSSLSGGETFLVSLALALGLAQLTGGGSPIQSLFIDEGFGALDQETLDDALETLDLLQSEGKTIGIISHVEALRERIASQIVVVPKDAGRSELEVRF